METGHGGDVKGDSARVGAACCHPSLLPHSDRLSNAHAELSKIPKHRTSASAVTSCGISTPNFDGIASLRDSREMLRVVAELVRTRVTGHKKLVSTIVYGPSGGIHAMGHILPLSR